MATNVLGESKTEVRNSQGQTVSVTDAAGNATIYTYDPFGDLSQVTDPQGHVTATLYDIRGHKFMSSDPDAGLSSYKYDPLGELLSSTDAKNLTTTYSYDLLGRITQRTEPDITSYWMYDFMPHGIGKLAYSYTSVGNTHIYNYDSLSRPTASWLLTSTSTLGITRTYDAVGRVATQTYPDGVSISNVYNAQGALTEVDPAGTYSGANTYLWKALAWDAAGHVTQEQFGNGVTTTHSYDPATLRPMGIAAGTGNSVMNQGYTYDALGNVQTRVDALAGTSELYTYDTINRLTQDATTLTNACTSNCTSSVNVAYDALGNITSKSDVGAYTYTDPAHIHAVTQAGSNTYTYDPDGNMMAGGGRSYTWTAANLPVSVTANGQTTGWTYDADRNRVTQTEPGKTTVFLNPRVDLGMHYEQVTYTGGRVDGVHILYAGGEIIGQYTTTNQTGVPPSTTRYWSTDPLGSVIAMTSDTGVVTDRYAYDPWGKQQVVSGSQDDTDHGYTGQEHLAVGLVQLNGRLYDPVIGRMVSVDPVIADIYELQTFNGYSYVDNNPLATTDPSGMDPMFDFSGSFDQGSGFVGLDMFNLTSSFTDASFSSTYSTSSFNSIDFGGGASYQGSGVFNFNAPPSSMSSIPGSSDTLNGGAFSINSQASMGASSHAIDLGEVSCCSDSQTNTGNANLSMYSGNVGYGDSWGGSVSYAAGMFTRGDSRSTYDRNNVMGGFDANGNSTVYNRSNYNPSAFAACLLCVASMVNPEEDLVVGAGLVARGVAVAKGAIGATGKIGEKALQALGGDSQVYFRTSQGGRYVDQLVNGVANESKVGYTSLTSDVRLQISKDVELMNTGQINGANWHFFQSPVTGMGGPSGPLSEFLEQSGIGVVRH